MRCATILGFAAISAILLRATPAEALLSHTCVFQPVHASGARSLWFTPPPSGGITVPVYQAISLCPRAGDGLLVSFNLAVATSLSPAELDYGIRQAINIWNEESGGPLRLRYMGTTSSCVVSGGVLIAGRTDVCVAGAAAAFATANPSTHLLLNSHIEFRRFTGGSNNGCSAPIDWRIRPFLGLATYEGFIRTLVHEFGHAVYNFGDVGEGPIGSDCEAIDGPTNMGHLAIPPTSHFSNWDLEVMQRRYWRRSDRAYFYKSLSAGATGWLPASVLNGDSGLFRKLPLYRFGSLSIGIPPRVLPWIYGAATVQNGGMARLDVSQYQGGGMPNWISLTGSNGALSRPVAITSKPGTTKVLLAYPKLNTSDPACSSVPCTVYQTDRAFICYRTSLNNGVSWSSETCSSEVTRTFGVTATYDAYTDNFLIGWSSYDWALKVLRINATSGASALNSLAVTSTRAPSIACSGLAECVLTYQTIDNIAVVGYLKFHLHPTTNAIIVDGSYSVGYVAYDTPSVIYDRDYSLYRMLNTQGSSAIYSYTMPYLGTIWTGSGDVFNNSSAFVSSGVLTTRAVHGALTQAYAFFVRYW